MGSWVPSKRHAVVGLCGVSTFICYADRVNISVTILHMGLTGAWRGWILASFFYGYFTTQLIGGLLSSRFGGSRVLNAAVAWWSAFTILTPWAARRSNHALFLCRVLMGAGEGLAYPAIYDIVSQWAPPLERARSFAAAQFGSKAGTMFALIVCPIIINASGWPAVFFGFGASGFLWNLAWMMWVGSEAPAVNYHAVPGDGAPDAESAALGKAKAVGAAEPPAAQEELSPRLARRLLALPSVWAIVAGHVTYNWGHYLLLSWLPTFLNEVHGVSKDNMSVSAVPFAFMSIGIGAWSSLADRWARHATLTSVRKGMTTIGLGGAGLLLLLLARAPDYLTAIMLASLSLGTQAAAGSGVLINHVDLAPRYSSVLFSLSNTFATLPGMVAVPLASAILAAPWGSWGHVFGLAAAVYAVGLAVYRRYMSAEPLNL